MKLFGSLRCKWFGCGPHKKHRLDADIDMYVCECCEASVLDGPASEEDLWKRTYGGLPMVRIGPNHAGHVWYCDERDQARVRL